jgi:hypothetical protein
VKLSLLLFALLVGTVGCERGPALVPVTGKVTFQGKPIVPGAVFIEPDDGPDGTVLRASGLLQLDGSFALRTYPHGQGAMPGTYRLYLQLGHGTKPELAAFTDVMRSPLTVVVPEEGLKDHHIELSEHIQGKR